MTLVEAFMRDWGYAVMVIFIWGLGGLLLWMLFRGDFFKDQ